MMNCDYIMFQGTPIIANEGCVKLVQKRKHRKKRINKKWFKRYGMKEVPEEHLFLIFGKVYCHPKMLDKIKTLLSETYEELYGKDSWKPAHFQMQELRQGCFRECEALEKEAAGPEEYLPELPWPAGSSSADRSRESHA